MAALCAGSKQVDPKLREEPGAFLGNFSSLAAEHNVFAQGEKIGEIDAETTGEMVVAYPGRAKGLSGN